MKLPQNVTVKSIELLRGGQTVPVHVDDQNLRFTIPRIDDYEVAAITLD